MQKSATAMAPATVATPTALHIIHIGWCQGCDSVLGSRSFTQTQR